MALHTHLVGEAPPRFVFLHGLFGRGRNWTGVARALAADGCSSLLVDLPDHGASPWSNRFDYFDYADQVAATLRDAGPGPVVLVGHSLGGKVAMLVALRHPQLVSGLVVVDIAPAPTAAAAEFRPLVAAMRGLDLDRLTSRTEADTLLAPDVPDRAERLFLLQNLQASPRWHWQPNLTLLGDNLTEIAGWPPVAGHYDGPVLWLLGGDSPYVTDADQAPMHALFPAVTTQIIPGASHWVHADHPQAVIDALLAFEKLT